MRALVKAHENKSGLTLEGGLDFFAFGAFIAGTFFLLGEGFALLFLGVIGKALASQEAVPLLAWAISSCLHVVVMVNYDWRLQPSRAQLRSCNSSGVQTGTADVT